MSLARITLGLLIMGAGSAALAQRHVLGETKSLEQISNVRAWNLLSKTIEDHRKVPCKALVDRRDSMTSEAMLEEWTEQSSDGKLKLTVLSPLSHQGITTVDDGQLWRTYHPDENRIIVETSPRGITGKSLKFRIHLAQQNYELEVEHGDQVVAGRRAYSFLATPKHSEMPSRRYCIDTEKPFLLRMEVLSDEGTKVILDTKTIEFPRDVPAEEFTFEPKEGAKTEYYTAPVPLVVDRKTNKALGFKPALPSNLPCGFAIEEPQLVEGQDGKFVAVRLTDGLVSATVYEWSHKKGGPKESNQANERTANGVRMRVVGEVPESVISEILESFIHEALKQAESCVLSILPKETLADSKALRCQEEDNRVDDATNGLVADYSENFALVLIEIEE